LKRRFDLDYRPAKRIERMRIGTPPILQLAALEAALDMWDLVDMNDLRAQSLQLGDLFISGVEACCPELKLATPREHDYCGSHVSFRHPEGLCDYAGAHFRRCDPRLPLSRHPAL
jgi:kynureninase